MLALPRSLQLTEQMATCLACKSVQVFENGQSTHLPRKEMNDQIYSEKKNPDLNLIAKLSRDSLFFFSVALKQIDKMECIFSYNCQKRFKNNLVS